MLEAILSTIDEGIHVINRDGITIFYNHIAALHDGLIIEEVIHKHIFDVFPSLDKESSTLLKVIETGKPIINQHQRYMNKNGANIITVNTTLPVFVNNKLVAAVEIAKDISKIKELSEKLIDLQAQFYPASKGKKSGEAYQAKYVFNDIITKNNKMKKIIEHAKKASFTNSPVLIEGETGTGKELFVQAIHNFSQRSNHPFIAQNCAAMPTPLLEGILFGTVKGSFTGAENRPGLFELAHEGTLFLDEINSMPTELQAKLLRVLQDGIVRRVGDNVNRQVNVRIIVATNEDPFKAIEEGKIRSDLFYRINVVHFKIPPLRDRKEDLKLLTNHFLQKYNYQFQRLILQISPEVEEIFFEYHWPGNIRELEHIIEFSMNIIDGDTIQIHHLPNYLQELEEKKGQYMKSDQQAATQKNIDFIAPWVQSKGIKDILSEWEKYWIFKALEIENGNVKKAAKLLKIPRQTLQYKISKYF